MMATSGVKVNCTKKAVLRKYIKDEVYQDLNNSLSWQSLFYLFTWFEYYLLSSDNE
jgi:hypothetical protein